ncbi:N-acetylmuramoyl-L-alanine amidase [Natronincola ferrireducens]|uniref:N-acetylmuramoyl-L-alanine amidase n=1 Tax=Natronincola ferrireducens TaxID=393762 RepID=A0A1G8Y6Q4_9FIRM|nr:N-acetylmuramoyl-L-alanine amidase [Natronincola ferrireducens]SDJ98317.1 N-acetylmuramoyl-L-alanine amidase [Natronincola ferrireducens]
MKKLISLLLVFIVLFTSCVYANTNSNTVRMLMDGRHIDFQRVNLMMEGKAVTTDVPAVIHQDRTLVPITFVALELGITPEWKRETREVVIKTKNKEIILTIDSPIATVNGEKKVLPSNVPPKLITYQGNGRTMMPIAFLSEELGLEAIWDRTTRTVSVEKKPQPLPSKAVKDVNFVINNGLPEIRVKTGEELSYNQFALSEPHRLVFDFQEAKFDIVDKNKLLSNGTLRLDVNSRGIGSIRASQFNIDPFITRVTIELDAMRNHQVFYDSQTDEMVIQLEGDEDNKITEAFHYEKINNLTSQLKLNSTTQVQFGFSVRDYGKILQVTVPKTAIDLSVKTMEINDGFVGNIFITEHLNKENYHIEILLQDNVDYKVVSPGNTKEYIIEFTVTQKPGIPLIVIDPGHGGSDPGATSPINRIREKDLVLDVAHYLNNLLLEAGFRTYMTRETDVSVVREDRAAIANQLNGDFFISIHANSFTTEVPSGIEHYYHAGTDGTGMDRDSKQAGKIIHDTMIEMTKSYGMRDRGLKKATNLVVLRETKMPAVLSEIGFLSNPNDAAWLATEEYKQVVAEALFQGIVKYFQTVK